MAHGGFGATGDENELEKEESMGGRERTEVGFGLEPLSPLVNVTRAPAVVHGTTECRLCREVEST
jgi:hypothetical protein